MLYREAGQFKTSYGADQAIFAIRQDRVALALFGVVAVLAVPVLASNYFLETIFVPFLVFAVAALGLNILTRSEEHTSELQSLMRKSYAVFCLKKKKQNRHDKFITT